MSTVSFVAQLDPNFLPIECFPLTYDLNVSKSRINKTSINCRFFLKRFPI